MVSEREQHVAMPQLRGAPAYARPPMPVTPSPRLLDPDDLPIEAARTDEERDLAQAALSGSAWVLHAYASASGPDSAGPAPAFVTSEQLAAMTAQEGGQSSAQGGLPARSFGLRAFTDKLRGHR